MVGTSGGIGQYGPNPSGIGTSKNQQVPYTSPHTGNNPYSQYVSGIGGQQNQYVPPRAQEPLRDPVMFNKVQIMEVIQDMYGPGQQRIEKPMFKKLYPTWIDSIPFPRGFQIPDLTLFNGEENQSTIEHVGRFCLQIGELGHDEVYRLKLFPHSLTRNAFTWFISLPPNSVHSWQEMEEQFHAQFFRHEPEISMADLAKLKQKPSETVEQFLTRFKKSRNQCHFYIPAIEVVKLAVNGLDYP